MNQSIASPVLGRFFLRHLCSLDSLIYVRINTLLDNNLLTKSKNNEQQNDKFRVACGECLAGDHRR